MAVPLPHLVEGVASVLPDVSLTWYAQGFWCSGGGSETAVGLNDRGRGQALVVGWSAALLQCFELLPPSGSMRLLVLP